MTLKATKFKKKLTHIPYDNEAAQKGGYDTFMLKEIHEQPYAISETLRGRVEGNDRIILPELEILKERFTTFNKVYFVACGTAYHACLSGANIMERLTGILLLPKPLQNLDMVTLSLMKKLCVFLSHNRVKLQIPWLLYV